MLGVGVELSVKRGLELGVSGTKDFGSPQAL